LADLMHGKSAVTNVLFGTGGAIAGTVYGTIIVMATLTAAYESEPHPWRLAIIVWSTALVFWLAHLYSHGLAESISRRQRLTASELAQIARRELGILLAAALPSSALLLGALGIIREGRSVWLALALGLVTLGAEGIRYARLETLSRRATLAIVAANLGLGLLVVALKVAVAH
jgi:hypothetical protein